MSQTQDYWSWENATFFSVENLSAIVYYLLGALLAYIRLVEPFVLRNLKTELKLFWYKITCRKRSNYKKLKKPKFSKESLCSFMNSAMNIEFVYLILIGINNFMEKLDTNDHEKILSERNGGRGLTKRITMDKNNKTTKITFHSIQFADIKQWDVGNSLRKTSHGEDEFQMDHNLFQEVPDLPDVQEEEEDVDVSEYWPTAGSVQ